MPLTRCRECQKEVSSDARRCPYCGAPLPAREGSSGRGFEWKSRQAFYGYPLVHIAFGRDDHNRIHVAKGVIAIGQFGVGLITFAQFGIGIVFGFGQFIFGLTGIAQFAITGLFGIGQFATGYIAIGQLALGYYVLAQVGLGKYMWTSATQDSQALEFFRNLLQNVKEFVRL
jgi:hypothetical protein